MNVHQPSGKTLDQYGRDDPHPPRHHNHLHIGGSEAVHQGLIQIFTVSQHPMIEHFAGNSQTFSPLLGPAARVVYDQQPEFGPQRSCLNRLGEGFEIACLLYTSPSPRDATLSRMPSSA